MKKRVALLVDNVLVSKQIYDLFKLSLKAKNYEITTILINEISTHEKNLIIRIILYIKTRGILKFISSSLFRLLCWLESFVIKRFTKFNNFYSNFDLSKENLDLIILKPDILKDGFSYRYTNHDIKKIKDENIDLIIRGGSGILKGEILNVCPGGVISFHHGDNDINRGGPPGFWEVYEQHPRTGFIIQRLTEELDGGDVLYKGFIQTSWFYSLNFVKLLEISNPFFSIVLDDITSSESTLSPQSKNPYSHDLKTAPNLSQIIFYVLKTLVIILRKSLRKLMRRRLHWGIAYQFIDDWKDSTLRKSIRIKNPKNRFLADPFLIRKAKTHYCYVEDFDFLASKANISVFEISKNGAKELGNALTEDFHLSYPFLFKYNGELYMCPETHEKREIRIYKCTEFPLKWEFQMTLMEDISAHDTNIFFHDDMWWLVTTIDHNENHDQVSKLCVFYSPNPLTKDWIPHEKNPVIFDPLKGRNGGLIKDSTGIYRVYQRQGFDSYGKSLGVTKISKISEKDYLEEDLFEIEPKFFKNIKGVHTYNYCKGLLVFDYLE